MSTHKSKISYTHPYNIYNFHYSYNFNYMVKYILSNYSFALIKYVRRSIGNGKTMVEFFSADIVFRVCR